MCFNFISLTPVYEISPKISELTTFQIYQMIQRKVTVGFIYYFCTFLLTCNRLLQLSFVLMPELYRKSVKENRLTHCFYQLLNILPFKRMFVYETFKMFYLRSDNIPNQNFYKQILRCSKITVDPSFFFCKVLQFCST